MPQPWTEVPPPPSEECWTATTNDDVAEGFLGGGTMEEPLLVFGDASGGADTSSSAFRRVGLGIAVFTQLEPSVELQATVRGPLAGPRQVVAR
eukprot:6309933-Pyramimonas_sp.AAC.1